MKLEIKATKGDKELVLVTEITSEQIPSFLQNLHRKLDELK